MNVETYGLSLLILSQPFPEIFSFSLSRTTIVSVFIAAIYLSWPATTIIIASHYKTIKHQHSDEENHQGQLLSHDLCLKSTCFTNRTTTSYFLCAISSRG